MATRIKPGTDAHGLQQARPQDGNEPVIMGHGSEREGPCSIVVLRYSSGLPLFVSPGDRLRPRQRRRRRRLGGEGLAPWTRREPRSSGPGFQPPLSRCRTVASAPPFHTRARQGPGSVGKQKVIALPPPLPGGGQGGRRGRRAGGERSHGLPSASLPAILVSRDERGKRWTAVRCSSQIASAGGRNKWRC
jgi:hypothetical protein